MPPLLTAIHNRGQCNPGHQLTITQKYGGQRRSQRSYPQHLALSELQQQALYPNKPETTERTEHGNSER